MHLFLTGGQCGGCHRLCARCRRDFLSARILQACHTQYQGRWFTTFPVVLTSGLTKTISQPWCCLLDRNIRLFLLQESLRLFIRNNCEHCSLIRKSCRWGCTILFHGEANNSRLTIHKRRQPTGDITESSIHNNAICIHFCSIDYKTQYDEQRFPLITLCYKIRL